MAEQFKRILDDAIADGTVLGASVCAVDSHGEEIVEYVAGKSDLGDDAPDFKMDTMFWMASSTKLLTSISALQLHERGLLSLTDPITSILPELSDLKICTGFTKPPSPEDAKPILTPSTIPITLTHLLTHSSGLGYDAFNPFLARYRRLSNLGPLNRLNTLPETFCNVLLFEPGQGWEYSPGIDWAGLVIERVSGMSLGDYMKKNIFDRVGVQKSDLCFEPWDEDKGVMERLHGRVTRDKQSGRVVRFADEAVYPDSPRGYHAGGGGVYGCTRGYIEVLRSLVMKDERLLKRAMVQRFFMTGQLEVKAKEALNQLLQNERWRNLGAIGLPVRTKGDGGEEGKGELVVINHGLGSAVVETRVEGICEKGMMYWGGIPNNNWWVDVDGGTAGHYGTWIVPPGDVPTGKLFGKLREAAYEKVTIGKRKE